MRLRTCALFALLAVSPAFGQGAGEIVFTDRENPAAGQAIRSWFAGSVTTRFTFAPDAGEATIRLADIHSGPSGDFYVSNGPLQAAASNASIFHVTGLFGVPSVTAFSSSNPMVNPIGLAYDSRTSSVLYVNNTAHTGFAYPPEAGGIGAAAVGGGAQTTIYHHLPNGTALPYPVLPEYLVADPQGGNDYYVTTVNGGTHLIPQGALPPNQNWSSQIYRMSFGTVADGSATMTQVVDFNGTPALLTDVRGITARPGTNELYITDIFTNSIYRVLLNGAGGFSSMNLVASGLGAPEVIQYDPYTNTLVFAELTSHRLSRINLDGTGYTILASDVFVRGIAIVPAPGVLGLLGLGVLAASRRRRAA